MTNPLATHAIEHELVRLNHVIDRKILRGLSYGQESQRHLELLQKLRRRQTQRPLQQLLTSFLLF